MDGAISVAISSCLLGDNVRYDGQARPAPWVTEALGPWVRWVSVCPEAGAGLGTPRAPIDLYQTPRGLRVMTLDQAQDHTERLLDYCRGVLLRLERERICGYVLKARSPSCGVGDARMHGAGSGAGDGLLVRLVRRAFPGLPLARDEDLRQAQACRRFLEQARAYHAAR